MKRGLSAAPALAAALLLGSCGGEFAIDVRVEMDPLLPSPASLRLTATLLDDTGGEIAFLAESSIDPAVFFSDPPVTNRLFIRPGPDAAAVRVEASAIDASGDTYARTITDVPRKSHIVHITLVIGSPDCGDGDLDGLEQCDDGNRTTGDGCSGGCTFDPGYGCIGEPSVCSPAISTSAGGACGGCLIPDCPAAPGVDCDAATASLSTDTASVAGPCTIASVEVYVHIDTTANADLTVDIASPSGVTVRLHDRSFESLWGYYELGGADLAVEGPGALGDFLGTDGVGAWTLISRDWNGGSDSVLEEWSVTILCIG